MNGTTGPSPTCTLELRGIVPASTAASRSATVSNFITPVSVTAAPLGGCLTSVVTSGALGVVTDVSVVSAAAASSSMSPISFLYVVKNPSVNRGFRVTAPGIRSSSCCSDPKKEEPYFAFSISKYVCIASEYFLLLIKVSTPSSCLMIVIPASFTSESEDSAPTICP